MPYLRLLIGGFCIAIGIKNVTDGAIELMSNRHGAPKPETPPEAFVVVPDESEVDEVIEVILGEGAQA
jgi:3-deoxy-D-arabino-heptulosonate 7-phosphate (DAHP) synthase